MTYRLRKLNWDDYMLFESAHMLVPFSHSYLPMPVHFRDSNDPRFRKVCLPK